MVNKIKAAVIGCGRMGAGPNRYFRELPIGWHPLSHVEAILETKMLELSALCDIDTDLLKKAGALYGINEKKQIKDYKFLIDEIRPDIITIATRTPSKKDIIQYACMHGVKGIYVEKPLANCLEDCLLISNLVNQYNVKLVYGVNRRYHSTYRTAKKIISEGEIGDIQDVTVDHGRSLLLWTHPHSVDLILYFLENNKLNTIQATLEMTQIYDTNNLSISEDPYVINALFQFSNSMTGKITNLSGLNVKITGSKGYLIIHGNGKFIEINTKKEASCPYILERKIIEPPDNEHKATVFALESLSNSIHEKLPLPINLNEINLGMRMLFGSMWSYLKGGSIIVPHEVPDNLVIEGMHNGKYA